MDFLSWLHDLGRDANAGAPGFQAKPLYVLMCVTLPVVIGLFVGFTLRIIEQVFGVELGRGGRH